MMVALLVQVALVAAVAFGLAFDAPVPTATIQAENADFKDLYEALTTMGPRTGVAELLKRDYQQTVLFASDDTCGYYSAFPTVSYHCRSAGQTCRLLESLSTVSGTAYGAIGCCGGTQNCDIFTSCIGSREYYSGSRCPDSSCAYCTSSFCNSIMVPGPNAIGYYCDTATTNAVQLLLTSNAQTVIHYSTSVVTITDGKTTATTKPTTSSPTTSPTSTTAISTTSPSTTSTTSPPSPTQTDASPGPPIGAIVGGSVGGVAVLAIIGAGIFFLMRRKRKARAAQAPPQQPQQPLQPPYYPNQGPQGPYNQPPMAQAQGAYMGADGLWKQMPATDPHGQGYGMQGSPQQYDKAYATPQVQSYYSGSTYTNSPQPQNQMSPNPDVRDSIASQQSSAYISPQSGSPPSQTQSWGANPGPAQLEGSNRYPHHDTIHEVS